MTRLNKRDWRVSSNVGASVQGPYSLASLVDNNLDTLFVSADNGYNNWFQIDFGKTVQVRQYK